MATITISRQLGSMGTAVARAVAERLGYRLVCRELINEAALKGGVPEMALATIDELGILGLRPSVTARHAYQKAVRQIMEQLAADGKVVVVGRAGQVVLHDTPGVVHVRVMAPATLRAMRVAQRHHISLESAEAQVEASDRSRRNHLQRYYHTRWDDPALYDLIINTAHFTPEWAADLICLAVERLQSTPGAAETERIEEPD